LSVSSSLTPSISLYFLISVLSLSNSDLSSIVRPIKEQMVFQLVCEKPANPELFMISWLQKQGGYTANGLTIEERSELERLRTEIRKYREMEGVNEEETDNKSDRSHESEDEDHEDEKVEIDLSKAKQRLSVPRAAVSAEVYGAFNQKENFQARVIKKTEEQTQKIKARILQSFLFCNLDAADLEIVINAMDERECLAGETIIDQGESGDTLFVVESGQLDCFKKFSKDSEPKQVRTYGPGEAFGELALLYNAPRAATVKASEKSQLWVLDRETFNHIVKDAAQKKREKYESFLKSVEILSTVEPYELTQISDALKAGTFQEGDYVIREGEMGDVFYIIEEGEAIATKTMEPGKQPEKVKSYGRADYFGELALIKGEPRAANIVAQSTLRVISLDRNSFKRLLGPIEDILKRNSAT